MEVVNEVFGVGKDLTALQMSARSFVFFFITLLYIRIAGMRSFGKKSSIDMIIVIVLGSVIARGIVGASGFGATAAASAVLVLVYRLVAWLTMQSKWVEKIVKGEKKLLYENGVYFRNNMYRTGISEDDILESLRLVAKTDDMKKVMAAYMETNGKISFILKPGG